MPDRIDYAYNAQERVKLAIQNPDEMQAMTTALIAQAEATLALVEQQRLASIIAWTTRDGHRPLPEVADEITEALGLS